MKVARLFFVFGLVGGTYSAFGQNSLVNPGWETGDLTGWTTNYPAPTTIVESTVVHSGNFAALMPQDYYLDQEFAPVDVSALKSVSYWIKQDQFQPNPTFFSANILYYSDGTNTYLVPRPANNGGWYLMDLTSYLTPGKKLVGIRVYGATTVGGPSPKTYFDDFNVSTAVPEPAALMALGLPAAILLKRRRK